MKRLLDLQRVDTAIDRLRQRKADLPEQRILDGLSAELEAARVAHAAKQSDLDSIAQDQGRLEGEVSMIEDKIKHESERLYGGDISNPKELASIQAELDGLRRRKNHLEDQDLEIMERRESVEAELAQLKEKLDELTSRRAEAETARDTAAVEIETDLAKNGSEREQVAPEIPAELLEIYDDLRSKKEGVGVAALVGGVCRGCGVSLSPMALDAIKHAASDDIPRCENCRRLVVPT
ncbi:MAG TPA: C4-type zinc ribbon domain-containing protein [Gaiellaceae bacterium]|nr:C4-type zinc ribbon domain-containing protein [Gaiellaceae bacterium]